MEEKIFYELTDQELDAISGGIDWKKFGSCVLNNGGPANPELSDLVAAIATEKWMDVAILGIVYMNKGNSIAARCYEEYM